MSVQLLGSAQDCLLAAGGEPVPFQNMNDIPLPSGSQAIITTYQFGCCGNITDWQTYLLPSNDGVYLIFFQVWRPSPTVKENGCYTLIGENRFSSVKVGDGGLVMQTPEPSDTITVQPGDVVGYFISSDRDPENKGKEGIQLNNSHTSDTVFHFNYSPPLFSFNYPATVFPTSTKAGPVLSLNIGKLSSTSLRIALVLFTLRFNLFARCKTREREREIN